MLNPVTLFTSAQRTCHFLFAKIRDGAQAAQKGSVSVTSVLGGDHAAIHTADSSHCVRHNDYECFCQIFRGFGNSWGREWSSDQQMNSGSQGVEKSEVAVYHTRPVAHTHIPPTHGFWWSDTVRCGAPPDHLFFSCCLSFELQHITSLSLSFSQNWRAQPVWYDCPMQIFNHEIFRKAAALYQRLSLLLICMKYALTFLWWHLA